MPFTTAWEVLLEELDDLPADAELIRPLSHDRFRLTDVQAQRADRARNSSLPGPESAIS